MNAQKFPVQLIAETGRDFKDDVEIRWLHETRLQGLHGSMVLLAVDMSDLPEDFTAHSTRMVCLAHDLAGLQNAKECAEINAEHWHNALKLANAKNHEVRKELREVQAKVRDLESRNETLEACRPHWAKGFTSDGIAAQVQTSALAQIWTVLGVEDQTAAMTALGGILNDRDRAVEKLDELHASIAAKELSEANTVDYARETSVRALGDGDPNTKKALVEEFAKFLESKGAKS